MTDQTGQQEALAPGMPGAAEQESGASVQDTGTAEAIAVEDVTLADALPLDIEGRAHQRWTGLRQRGHQIGNRHGRLRLDRDLFRIGRQTGGP